jgi:hypothetical protein
MVRRKNSSTLTLLTPCHASLMAHQDILSRILPTISTPQQTPLFPPFPSSTPKPKPIIWIQQDSNSHFFHTALPTPPPESVLEVISIGWIDSTPCLVSTSTAWTKRGGSWTPRDALCRRPQQAGKWEVVWASLPVGLCTRWMGKCWIM